MLLRHRFGQSSTLTINTSNISSTSLSSLVSNRQPSNTITTVTPKNNCGIAAPQVFLHRRFLHVEPKQNYYAQSFLASQSVTSSFNNKKDQPFWRGYYSSSSSPFLVTSKNRFQNSPSPQLPLLYTPLRTCATGTGTTSPIGRNQKKHRVLFTTEKTKTKTSLPYAEIKPQDHSKEFISFLQQLGSSKKLPKDIIGSSRSPLTRASRLLWDISEDPSSHMVQKHETLDPTMVPVNTQANRLTHYLSKYADVPATVTQELLNAQVASDIMFKKYQIERSRTILERIKDRHVSLANVDVNTMVSLFSSRFVSVAPHPTSASAFAGRWMGANSTRIVDSSSCLVAGAASPNSKRQSLKLSSNKVAIISGPSGCGKTVVSILACPKLRSSACFYARCADLNVSDISSRSSLQQRNTQALHRVVLLFYSYFYQEPEASPQQKQKVCASRQKKTRVREIAAFFAKNKIKVDDDGRILNQNFSQMLSNFFSSTSLFGPTSSLLEYDGSLTLVFDEIGTQPIFLRALCKIWTQIRGPLATFFRVKPTNLFLVTVCTGAENLQHLRKMGFYYEVFSLRTTNFLGLMFNSNRDLVEANPYLVGLRNSLFPDKNDDVPIACDAATQRFLQLCQSPRCVGIVFSILDHLYKIRTDYVALSLASPLNASEVRCMIPFLNLHACDILCRLNGQASRSEPALRHKKSRSKKLKPQNKKN